MRHSEKLNMLTDDEFKKTVRLEEMRPRQIIAARDEFPAVYLGVGPLEWHSYHVPFGNDGMIGHCTMIEIAKICGGVVMPPVYLGTDSERTPELRKKWGLPMDGSIVGMNQPALPLTSMYCSEDLLFQTLKMELDWAKTNGFKYAFIMPSHEGEGHVPTCEKAASCATEEEFQAEVVMSENFMDDGVEYIDGHGRIDETEIIMAFRPELVDLSELPEGPLTVAEYGMLYPVPNIPPKANPVNSNPKRGEDKIRILTRNLSRHIRNVVKGTPEQRDVL